jgi:hypothetical protein
MSIATIFRFLTVTPHSWAGLVAAGYRAGLIRDG